MAVRQAVGSLELQGSEAAVVHAASRILAALIRNGRLTEGNHSSLVRFAVRLALDLAYEVDRGVQSDDEPARPQTLAAPAASSGAAAGAEVSTDDLLELLD